MKKLFGIIALTLTTAVSASSVVEKQQRVTCADTKIVFGYLTKERKAEPVFIAKDKSKAFVVLWMSKGGEGYVTASPQESSETCVLAELAELEVVKK